MNLLALDLSLTSTGWAAQHGAPPVASGTFNPKGTGAPRLHSVVVWLGTLLKVWTPDLVVLEGYSFASPNRAHHIGELGGVVRLQLFQRGFPFVELAPKVRAKLATGKGNAGKDQVLVEAVRRLGYRGHSNDEADALWLLQAALIVYAQPGAVELPRDHRAALGGVDFPFAGALLARAS